MNQKQTLIQRIQAIETQLKTYFPKTDNLQKQIYDAMEYSLFAGGKRLRPVLMLSVYEMYQDDIQRVLPFACAMEMIHTYSLIHDDLPAMDNDDFRRGRPTNHKQFGEAMAILAGDALLTKAFEIVSEYRGEHSDAVLEAIHILAASAGTEGMIGGQMVDMESETRSITKEELEYLHQLKTGAIIRSSCEIGAVLANAPEHERQALYEFASCLGLAFQIQDDILDVTGDEQTLGKPIGSDSASGKQTYVTLYGLEQAQRLEEKYSEKAVQALHCFGNRAEFLLWLAKYLTHRAS
jgi:geranylgeranyl diphosphate synthase type II